MHKNMRSDAKVMAACSGKCHCRCYDEGRDVNALRGFGKYAKAVAVIVDDRTTAFFAVCGNA